jgi:hypothetical protein
MTLYIVTRCSDELEDNLVIGVCGSKPSAKALIKADRQECRECPYMESMADVDATFTWNVEEAEFYP